MRFDFDIIEAIRSTTLVTNIACFFLRVERSTQLVKFVLWPKYKTNLTRIYSIYIYFFGDQFKYLFRCMLLSVKQIVYLKM